ncbi:coenzyme F420-0:L-glutamate ligase [Nocardioides campestrisoli]|uniref:coenzyme F420-0:L-glutamate ligase n=1 Tax=Nocardioides campestrisoli TaxID=2736757 RepID=UPI0015E6981E|nr:coenzyme F420-0:L-glutamate ligase [Nocardioides campestrisoli]
MAATGRLEVVAPDGVPEISAGTDLVDLVATALSRVEPGPADGDVVVVTSKVVSKAEGRVCDAADYDRALAEESTRVLASRGRTRIVRHRLGLVLAAAGIDRSNVEPGRIVLLPRDPDGSAARLRAGLRERLGVNVAVVVTDTFGRAWREGQTDVAIGVAGLLPLESHLGMLDAHGHELAVTAPAVADEIAGAVELAQGKLGGRPLALVRGRADLVLPVGEDGPGAGPLQRVAELDMFSLGVREAVVTALAQDGADQSLFGPPATPEELGSALTRVLGVPVRLGDGTADGTPGHEVTLPADTPREVVAALCFSHGWRLADSRLRETRSGAGAVVRLLPVIP